MSPIAPCGLAANHPPLPSRQEREELFAKCFGKVRDTGMASGWFFSVDTGLIKRDNMVDWLLWAIFGTHRDGLQDEWADELEGYLRNIEELLGHKIDHGRAHTVASMKVSLDPVDTVHRPLLWYLIVASIDTFTFIQLRFSGFEHYTNGSWTECFPPRPLTAFSHKSNQDDLIYWLRPHRSPTKDPILFLHGIGIGLWTYAPFLHELAAADPSVGIIAIETLAISMRMSPPPLSRPTMLSAISALLTAHSIPRVVVAAHSYGTVVAAHMLRDPALRARVSAWLLVDPIPFLLHQPTVAYNFVYRAPRTANEWQLWYFASRDPDVARTLARHFFWAENILWKEDLADKNVAVVLSGIDQIVDAREVRRYLTGEECLEGDEPMFSWRKDGLRVLWYRDLDHAQTFDTKARRRPILDILHEFAGAGRRCIPMAPSESLNEKWCLAVAGYT
ncbi:Alpha/Beta hydrolase protein [Ganoderma leucocontextum]|nr:Alpha/Beta hydrolase protein [Ganoderma leucocontextum]